MRGRAIAVAVAVAALGLAVLPAGAASAHPLGNFTVNTADRLVVTAGGVTVQHVVDLAELPTVQLGQSRAAVDVDDDGTLSPPELTAYAARECARIISTLELVVDGSPAPLALISSSGASRPGAAGLPTTRLECTFAAAERPRTEVRFTDGIAGDRNGWREVSASSQCGPLVDSSVPVESPSGLLVTYPEELLSSPADVTTASFSVSAGAACTAGSSSSVADEDDVAPRGLDRLSRSFTDFVNPSDLSAGFAVVAVAASLLFGALHALAPGHGKTVMAAYLVGQRGTRRQALQLGVFVTFSHTASVLALGLALSSATLVRPELVVPGTEVLAGLLLAAVGLYLFALAVRRLRAVADHDHDDPHPHPHDHEPHDEGVVHDHGDPPTRVLVAAGTAPVPALASPAVQPLVHSHGGRAHTHAPMPEGRLSFRTLAAVGVAGGLVPSPSALLVLLGATAVGRAWFGVVLVVAYGLGMAATLTAAGLLLLRARAAVDRRGWTGGRAARAVRLLPLVAAVVVLGLGLVLAVRGIGTGRPLL